MRLADVRIHETQLGREEMTDEGVEQGNWMRTAWLPCRSTSASAPSWSYRGYMAADRARRSRSSHRRGGFGKAYHLPTHASPSAIHPSNHLHLISCINCPHTSGTFSLSVCAEAASVVTERPAITLRANALVLARGRALLVLSACENILCGVVLCYVVLRGEGGFQLRARI